MTIMRDDTNYGGTLDISLNKYYFNEKNTLFSKIEDEEVYEISIRDTGVGIEQEKIKSIFDPFYTTKPYEKGTGLGLSMVFSVIKKHDGYIDVISQIGIGTIVKIYIPVYQKNSNDIKKNQKKIDDIKHGEGNILIIDDEKIIQETTKEMLKLCGYNVFCASSALEGIDFLKENSEKIDLIILDMAMPELSGKDAFIHIKKSYPKIKVLLASGYSQDERVLDVIKLGVDGFINKPFNLNELASKVYKAIYEQG
jgi:CheY-like chemotaxis protein